MSFLLFLDTFPYSRDFVVSPVSRKEARRTLVIISFVAEYPEAEGDNKEEGFHFAILQFVFSSFYCLADILNFDNLCSLYTRHDDAALHFLSMWNNKDIKFRSTLRFVYTTHPPTFLITFKLKTQRTSCW